MGLIRHYFVIRIDSFVIPPALPLRRAMIEEE